MAGLTCARCGEVFDTTQEEDEHPFDCPANAETVDHPSHYGGKDNVYEAIKVIESWELNFSLGNAVKYISRAGKKAGADELEDLKKARWYLDREIQRREKT
jgi:hypothetical protein